jgi:hypothetical protein
MNIKLLEQQELLRAMNLVWNVFVEQTAPQCTKETVESFQSFIKIESITEQFYRGELFLWGAYEGATLIGVSVLTKAGLVCLVSVNTAYQAQGVEQALIESMKQFCAQSLGIMRMYVQASPNTVTTYQALGFQVVSAEQVENGVHFVQMDYVISPASVQTNAKKSHVGIVIGIIVGVVIFLMVAIFIAGNAIYRGFRSHTSTWDSGDTYDYYDSDDYDYEYDDEEYDNSFESLEAYIADDLAYEIEEVEYDEYENLDSSVILIYAAYPQLVGLDNVHAETINQVLEDYAMQFANEYYINPSQETKETLLQEDLYIMQELDYRILYADNQVISVLFDNSLYIGELLDSNFEMTGMTIDLRDGTVYDGKDLFEYDDAFMEEWLEIMRIEAHGNLMLEDLLTLEEMHGILTGTEEIEGYQRVFFMSEQGIEVGISYPNGCVTAPYSWKALEEHKTDSPLWTLMEETR